ncbi:TniQ family protein [Deinococcus petrolearius]|uniref:TniQ family protein n=1 Tax=Deinococcus petrolearius TaxID=1751295 RepID=A0ABW1DMQ0_9DEIO
MADPSVDLPDLPLPFAVTPISGESLASWLARLASAYGLSARALRSTVKRWCCELTDPINLSDLQQAPEPLITILATRVGLAPSQLQPLLLPQRYAASFDTQPTSSTQRPRSFSAHASWVLPGGAAVYCPQCLSEDDTPFFRRAWRLRVTTVCPVHGIPLRERCPHCSEVTGRFNSEHGPGGCRLCDVCGSDLCGPVSTGRPKACHSTANLLVDAVLLQQTSIDQVGRGWSTALNCWDFAGAFLDWMSLIGIETINRFLVSGRPLPKTMTWGAANLRQRSAFVESFHCFVSLNVDQKLKIITELSAQAQLDFFQCMALHHRIGRTFTLDHDPWQGLAHSTFHPAGFSIVLSLGQRVSVEGMSAEAHLVYAGWHTHQETGEQYHVGSTDNLQDAMARCAAEHQERCAGLSPPFEARPSNHRISACPRCMSLYSVTASVVPLVKPVLSTGAS